jgi:hypothetical protein
MQHGTLQFRSHNFIPELTDKSVYILTEVDYEDQQNMSRLFQTTQRMQIRFSFSPINAVE